MSSVTVNPLPLVSVISQSTCAGGAAGFTLSGASSYTWSTGAATNILSVSPTVSTVYGFTAYSALGCQQQYTVMATVAPLPTVSVSGGTVCEGVSFTLNPSGAATYSFSSGSAMVSPLVTTSYSVTGFSAEGCSSGNIAVATVSVAPAPVLTVNSGTSCPGSPFVIVASGASSYSYSTGSPTIFPFAQTVYSVSGINSLGCQALVPATGTVVMAPLPALSVSGSTLVCEGAAASWTPAGAVTYTLNGSAPGPVFNFTPSGSATYTISGTGANGCSGSNTVALVVSPLPTLGVSSASICQGETYSIIPSGAATYTISGNSFNVTPSVTTVYTLTGTSQAGCDAATPVLSTVFVHQFMPVAVSGPSVVCLGQQATLTASGAATYTWSSGATGAQIVVTPSVSGLWYNVLTTSTAGCFGAAGHSIMVNPNPTITVASGAVCPGFSYTLAPAGAITYSYLPSGPVVTPVVSSTYTISGTDQNGCASFAVASVSVVNSLSVNITGNNILCAGESATLQANGASTYSWSNTQVGNVIVVTPGSTTSYTVEGTSGSCSSTAVMDVTVNPLPVVAVNSGSVCAGQPFTMIPSGAYTYTYSSGSPTVMPPLTTTYAVIGTDFNGCVSAPATSTVLVFQLPTVSASANAVVCIGDAVVLTAGGAQLYQWSTGDTGSAITLTLLAPESVTVTGTDENGCAASAVLVIATDPCTGHTELAAAEEPYLFPNPSTGQFMVRNPGESATMTITDLKGSVILNKAIPAHSTAHIDAKMLARGMYLCTFTRNGKMTTVLKVVISE